MDVLKLSCKKVIIIIKKKRLPRFNVKLLQLLTTKIHVVKLSISYYHSPIVSQTLEYI